MKPLDIVNPSYKGYDHSLIGKFRFYSSGLHAFKIRVKIILEDY